MPNIPQKFVEFHLNLCQVAQSAVNGVDRQSGFPIGWYLVPICIDATQSSIVRMLSSKPFLYSELFFQTIWY